MERVRPEGLEVSPSPVYGARLLSGFGAQPHRWFKSRHLRQLYIEPSATPGARVFPGVPRCESTLRLRL